MRVARGLLMMTTVPGFPPLRLLVIGLFALASLGVACGSSVSSGGAAGGAGGKGGGGGAGSTGGAPAAPCFYTHSITEGTPCDQSDELCDGQGTGCYPVVKCVNGTWHVSTFTCSAGSGGSTSGAGGTGGTGGTSSSGTTTTTTTATGTTGTGG